MMPLNGILELEKITRCCNYFQQCPLVRASDIVVNYSKSSEASQSSRNHYILYYPFQLLLAGYNGLAHTNSMQCYYKHGRPAEIIIKILLLNPSLTHTVAHNVIQFINTSTSNK